jgi:hypothetical protein
METSLPPPTAPTWPSKGTPKKSKTSRVSDFYTSSSGMTYSMCICIVIYVVIACFLAIGIFTQPGRRPGHHPIRRHGSKMIPNNEFEKYVDAMPQNGEMMFGSLAKHKENFTREKYAHMMRQAVAVDDACSSTCICSSGGIMPYGRYCGFGYSGCSGVEPCDALDACCVTHDNCVGLFGMFNCTCHVALTRCVRCALAQPPGSWDCDKRTYAGLRIIADVKFIMPACYERIT